MSKVTERQKFIRYWMDQTGEAEVDMHAVARMAMKMGWKAPPPVTEEDRIAKLFKDAARQDVRHEPWDREVPNMIKNIVQRHGGGL